MFVVLNGKRFESTLIKMPGSNISAMSVPALSVCQRQPADETRQFLIFVRFDNQMPVIVHQAKRQQFRPGPFDRLKQDPSKRLKIVFVFVFVFKNRQPHFCAIQHVINQTTFRCSLPSAYRKRLQNQPHRVN